MASVLLEYEPYVGQPRRRNLRANRVKITGSPNNATSTHSSRSTGIKLSPSVPLSKVLPKAKQA